MEMAQKAHPNRQLLNVVSEEHGLIAVCQWPNRLVQGYLIPPLVLESILVEYEAICWGGGCHWVAWLFRWSGWLRGLRPPSLVV